MPPFTRPAVHSARRRGFTLLEVLVCVGIIALVIGIALPMLLRSRTKALIIRTRADLNTIAGALDEYKHTFGDYPRFADRSVYQNGGPSGAGTGYWLDSAPDRGARLLCRALIGPGPAGNAVLAKPGEDGADGLGFRTRRIIAGGSTNGVLSGRVFTPILAADRFKLETDTTGIYTRFEDAKMLDANGVPILYFPAQPGPANPASAFVASCDPLTGTTTNGTKPVYYALDDATDTTPAAGMKPLLPAAEMQVLLTNPLPTHPGADYLQSGESAVTTAPFLLWTAGPDGAFGRFPPGSGKTDDVVYNVDLSPAVVK